MIKFGIKAGVLLSSLALALVFVVGCNSDEPAATKPADGAGAKAPADKPVTPTTTKPDDKAK